MRRSLIITLATAFALTACGGGLDEDTPLADQIDGDERQEAIAGIMDGAAGVLAESEAACWVDAMLDSGTTPGEMLAFGDSPLDTTNAEMAGMLTGCIDASLDVDAPFDGQLRDDLAKGFVTGGVTREAAECIIDGLEADGYDACDITVAGWMNDLEAPVMTAIGELAITC